MVLVENGEKCIPQQIAVFFVNLIGNIFSFKKLN